MLHDFRHYRRPQGEDSWSTRMVPARGRFTCWGDGYESKVNLLLIRRI